MEWTVAILLGVVLYYFGKFDRSLCELISVQKESNRLLETVSLAVDEIRGAVGFGFKNELDKHASQIEKGMDDIKHKLDALRRDRH